MTPADIDARLAVLADPRHSAQARPALEFDLWYAALRSIADKTASDPAAVAGAALRSRELDFPRWYS